MITIPTCAASGDCSDLTVAVVFLSLMIVGGLVTWVCCCYFCCKRLQKVPVRIQPEEQPIIQQDNAGNQQNVNEENNQ